MQTFVQVFNGVYDFNLLCFIKQMSWVEKEASQFSCSVVLGACEYKIYSHQHP